MILREAGVESLTGRSLLAALGGGLAAHVLRLFALGLYRAALRTVAARNVLFVLARFLGVQAGLRLMLAPLVGNVGCRCRQFWRDNVVSADMSATCCQTDITCHPF